MDKSFCNDTSPFDIGVCMDPSNVYLGKPSKLVKTSLDDNKKLD